MDWTDDLAFAPATEQARLVRDRDVSPVELVDLYLTRIDKIDHALNSVVTLDDERARAAARAAADQAGAADAPPFCGVPILIKDLHLTEGIRTTCGSRALADLVPPFDEEHVARIRRAGFIVLGKTNVCEFGTLPWTESVLLGPCRNPWDPDRTPGGSSGGAAAALAAGLCPVAHGSDGGGSIRIPSSNCGLFGLKPSRGRVSGAPLFGEMAQGLSTPGPIARHVVDAAALLDVMAGYVTGDPYWLPDPPRPYADEAATDPPPLRVGVFAKSPFATFHPDTLAALETATRLMGDLGHAVEEAALPVPTEAHKAAFQLLWACGFAAAPVDHTQLEPFNAALARFAAEQSAADLVRARHTLQLLSRQIIGAAADFDVVLTPTIAEPPLRIGELSNGNDDLEAMFDRLAQYLGLTPVANFTGLPAANLPLHWADVDGGPPLPIGVMVHGRPGDEATLVRLAAQAQGATDWSARRPPIS